jgi:hypothetical protein
MVDPRFIRIPRAGPIVWVVGRVEPTEAERLTGGLAEEPSKDRLMFCSRRVVIPKPTRSAPPDRFRFSRSAPAKSG